MTDSSILSNTYIQLGFSSSDSLGKFLKSLKTFATSDMDYCKEVSSGNSINFDESTKRYAHSSGGRKNQMKSTDTCKDESTKLIIAGIYPLRPRPDASKHLSYIFGRFDIYEGNPLHL